MAKRLTETPAQYKARRQAYWRSRAKQFGANTRFVRLYGITLAQRDAMVEDQKGLCAICGDFMGTMKGQNKYNIDHDHRTGRVRAILCGACNRGLGQFKDSLARLELAASYLSKHNALNNN